MNIHHNHARRVSFVDDHLVQCVGKVSQGLAFHFHVKQSPFLLPGLASHKGIHGQVKRLHAHVAQKSEPARIDPKNGDGALTHHGACLQNCPIPSKRQQHIHTFRDVAFKGYQTLGHFHMVAEFVHVRLEHPCGWVEGQHPVHRKTQRLCVVGRNRFSKEGYAHGNVV